jgi:hypothetical protein
LDVEKLKKVNQLSKDLKKHGMAMEDAIEQASDSVHETEIKEFLHESKEQMQSSSNPSSTEQYIIMLERNNRKIMEEVQKVKEEVAKIMSEFAEIKNKLHEQPDPVQEPVQKQVPVTKKVEKQSKLKPKKKIKNEKQGDINPEDVSIEKMFYFGKK